MPHYKTLKAWQHAQRLAIECSKAARGFPEYEQTSLADQLRRAGYAVPLKIAEGNTHRGVREGRQYLDRARSSLAEVETILQMTRELEYLSPTDYGRLEALADEAGKTLYGLLRSIGGVPTRGGPSSRTSTPH